MQVHITITTTWNYFFYVEQYLTLPRCWVRYRCFTFFLKFTLMWNFFLRRTVSDITSLSSALPLLHIFFTFTLMWNYFLRWTVSDITVASHFFTFTLMWNYFLRWTVSDITSLSSALPSRYCFTLLYGVMVTIDISKVCKSVLAYLQEKTDVIGGLYIFFQ